MYFVFDLDYRVTQGPRDKVNQLWTKKKKNNAFRSMLISTSHRDDDNCLLLRFPKLRPRTIKKENIQMARPVRRLRWSKCAKFFFCLEEVRPMICKGYLNTETGTPLPPLSPLPPLPPPLPVLVKVSPTIFHAKNIPFISFKF